MRDEDEQGAGSATTGREGAAARRRRRRLVALFVVLALVIGAGLAAYTMVRRAFFAPTCHFTASGTTETLDPEQAGNAATIAGVTVRRGLPARAASIGLATAMQESKLINVKYGDRDSLGLFQQRPSQGWGTSAQILDPVYATNKFYDGLVKVPGYAHGDLAEAAQEVQRSADGRAYAQHEAKAKVIASALTGQSPAGVVCDLDEPKTRANPSQVQGDLRAQLGLTATVQTDTTSQQDGSTQPTTVTIQAPSEQHAWAAGGWAVARAQRYGVTKVAVGQRTWTRSDGGSWSDGTAGTTVVITL